MALIRLGFPTAPHLWCLTLPVCTTRRTFLQKVRGSSYNEVPQLVNTGFQVLFHSPPGVLFTFPSQYYVCTTRRTFLQKVRGSSYNEVPQLVNTGFQVLFHSPPGVLFTFPSQYYTLTVTEEYLALRGGPRVFPQGFSCLVFLWMPLDLFYFQVRGFHPLWLAFTKPFS